MQREKPRKIFVGEADGASSGLRMRVRGEGSSGCFLAVSSSVGGGGGDGGGRMMSVALKGSVIPLGRRWPVSEKARMRKVVFFEVRWERLVVKVG